MHVRGMCRLVLVALARLESGQAKLRETSKGCDNHRAGSTRELIHGRHF